ncbi:hypothetical protein [Azospirillum sp. B4]|uniref:hypothetical protein n=1 Tax=Azospirillum sp. B4 TaxID=95605 RepID=UPI00034632AA|nr:hypothetical protein [Azospirillum sp. B4]
MPGKTSTPSPSWPVATYLRSLRGNPAARPVPPHDNGRDAPANPAAAQMMGSCGTAQMMAGRAEDPALVHF